MNGNKDKSDSHTRNSDNPLNKFKEFVLGGGDLQNYESKNEHQFWDTQPVPKMGEPSKITGPIQKDICNNVDTIPLSLPSGLEWTEIDMMNDEQAKEVFDLLKNNYVEDSDAEFRFAYPIEFLRWAITTPGYHQDWHIGFRSINNHQLMAFVAAVPKSITIIKDTQKMAEVNFLCIHKKIRSKRLNPILLKELSRRVRLRGVGYGLYTSGTLLPKPITKCIYLHRNLNPEKLVDIKFSYIPLAFRRISDHPMEEMKKHYQLPNEPTINGVREMRSEDIPQVYELLKNYLNKFKLHLNFSQDECDHWFLPRKNVIHSFVVESQGKTSEERKITDFFSFYLLPSSILGHPSYNILRAAYSFYNVATSVSLETLLYNALIQAKLLDMDVFNALNLMENEDVLQNLKFGLGDGSLYYYLFNYALSSSCSSSFAINPQDVGIVML